MDSGTLTPLLKKMEAKGLVTRERNEKDERNLVISITPEGEALRDKAVDIPEAIAGCTQLTQEDAVSLYRILYKLLGKENQDMEF